MIIPEYLHSFDIIVTLDEIAHSLSGPCITTRLKKLAEHQRELTHSNNCVYTRIIEQPTGVAVENAIQETS
jgi:hypothetical protein